MEFSLGQFFDRFAPSWTRRFSAGDPTIRKAEISIGYERVYTTTVSNSDVDDDAQKRRLAGKTVAILSFSP